MKLPLATEAERGIASVALNNPATFLTQLDEKKFNTADMFDVLSRAVAETILDLTARSMSTDVRVVYERLRERLPSLQFSQLTELYSIMPIEGALPNLLDAVKSAAKRRALMTIMQNGMSQIDAPAVSTVDLVNSVQSGVSALQNELNPAPVMTIRSMCFERLNRYEHGQDESQIIKTGFKKLDNLTPIQKGDLLIIGGETKSGKTMFALNIIAHLLQPKQK